jgi:hypothetical protein
MGLGGCMWCWCRMGRLRGWRDGSGDGGNRLWNETRMTLEPQMNQGYGGKSWLDGWGCGLVSMSY